jgi:hypothetical protein
MIALGATDIGKIYKGASEVQKIYLGATEVWSGFDDDAIFYINAVENADEQTLEIGVKMAINNLFLGLKADNEWSAIKALRIYAGPRTLAGCAVPAKGAAPTLINFVAGDINRLTGIKGNGSNKYVNHNRNNNADPQDNQQMWSFLTDPIIDNGQTQVVMGVGLAQTGATHIGRTNTAVSYFNRNRNTNTATGIAIGSGVGLVGFSRNNNATYDIRSNGITQTNAMPSQSPFNGDVWSFARNASARSYSNHRAAVEAIGEAWTNPNNIEARIVTYLSAIENSIP